MCFRYFNKQNKIIEEATDQIKSYIAGDTNAHIDCNAEGKRVLPTFPTVIPHSLF